MKNLTYIFGFKHDIYINDITAHQWCEFAIHSSDANADLLFSIFRGHHVWEVYQFDHCKINEKHVRPIDN